MFVHLGGNKMIRTREVIAILDASSPHIFPFVDRARREGRFVVIAPQDVKSFIVTGTLVYASPISPYTLMKRANDGPNRLSRSEDGLGSDQESRE
ncbi:MAG: extracellular matrix regulator RemB [Planifilum sp.]